MSLETQWQPTLGWAALSRSALKRAEAQLLQESEGVRDEVGVLMLHTAYANRFFPGTSVQQTRLRYAVFVPWQIQELLKRGEDVRPAMVRVALEDAELKLAKRLPDINGEQTIGRRMAKLGKPVAIAPSQSYWVALKAWGILSAGFTGPAASRSDLFTRWNSWPDGRSSRIRERDADNNPLEVLVRLFHPRLPEPPRAFRGSGPLDFRLEEKERDFLRTRLLETRRPGDGEPSLLANLVQAGVAPKEDSHPWNRAIAKHADAADRAALERARGAAALAAVARAIYNAMVESLQDSRDRVSPGGIHRSHLYKVTAEHGLLAQQLDLGCLPKDGVYLGEFAPVLHRIQAWLGRDGRNPLAKDLLEALANWELRRKGFRRSRLSFTSTARQARDHWIGEETPIAGPIEFRWHLIRRYLTDLEG